MQKIVKSAALMSAGLFGVFSPALADNLYSGGNWSAVATDRRAQQVGDIITIVVYESASASNTAGTNSKKGISLDGSISGGSLNESGGLGLSGSSDAMGGTVRSGKMVAQISGTVETVLPNGDLIIVGQQAMNINGEKTIIKVRGRIRPSDITASNMILSSRIADATIDYDGKGFVSRSAKPGILTKIFNFLGLM